MAEVEDVGDEVEVVEEIATPRKESGSVTFAFVLTLNTKSATVSV